MKYRLYTTSSKAWDGMFKAMAKAEKSIYLEMYILSFDTNETHNFFHLLEDKARSGVNVVIIADAYGSSSLKPEMVKSLRGAGAEFIFFSHWLKRTHRKILIIDNKVAFLGGVNIEEKIRNWRDLQIKIEGGAVKLIARTFAKSYRKCGGRQQSVLQLSSASFSNRITSRIMENWTGTNKLYYLNNYYQHKIAEAQSLIQIVTPYLLPPRWLIAALDDACRRGVKIEIIIPLDTDVKALNKINYLNCCRLSNIGVKFFMTKTMNHAKLMLIDNLEGLVGSQNMDIFSFGWNFEVGIFSRQKNLVADLEKIIETWKGEAEPFDVEYKTKISLSDRLLIHFFKFFYPIF
ncbi:MAG: phosphatidylserine/phosphatidylglycerophosphate/cardiolipin synthase family protein [Patescibacteria group bacterium]